MSVKTKQLGCVEFSEELLAVIEQARDGNPKGSWIERELWKLPAIKKVAAQLGIENPKREMDRRGKTYHPTQDVRSKRASKKRAK